MQKHRDIRLFRKVAFKAAENAVDPGQTGDSNFRYLLTKYRNVSRGYDTRNQVVLTGSWVRIPPLPPKRDKLVVGTSLSPLLSVNRLKNRIMVLITA